MSTGKSVRLFLADGTPGCPAYRRDHELDGRHRRGAEVGPGGASQAPETGRTGIYILLGDDPESVGGQIAYVGEADDVSKRLYQHGRPEDQGGKDFWDRAIVITSKDTNLTEAHARYLQSRFISLGLQANRAKLTNSTAPEPIVLPEADVSDMEYFIEQARIMLPVLGVNIFRSPVARRRYKPNRLPRTNPQPRLFSSFASEARLHGYSAGDRWEFTVRTDSTARLKWTGAGGHNYRGLRKVERDGTLVPSSDGTTMRFTHSQVFASPSAAAAVVTGRSANGRNECVTQDGSLAYGDWQRQGVDDALKEIAE
jgi:hypothetical protein